MVTLVVETGSGSATANTYASNTNSDDYHGKHLYASDWTGASEGDQDIALTMATRLLDENMNWDGTKNNKDNALEWPRVGVNDRAGFVIASNSIPQSLIDATSEFSRHLLAGDRTADSDTRGFKKLKAGTLEMEIASNDRVGIIPKVVANMLAHLGSTVNQGNIPLERT